METTPSRLLTLENETHGSLARGTEATVGGWNVITLPSGEKIAKVELDYNEGTDYTWSAEGFTTIQEAVPSSIFSNVNHCECKVVDISSGVANKCTLVVTIKEFYSTVATDKITMYSPEWIWGLSGYTRPSKLHIEWIMRGIKES